MKLLASGDVTAGSLVANVDSGLYKSFVFLFTGTNNASVASAAADFGTIYLTKGGKQFVNIDFADLQSINDLKGGAVPAASTTGGAFTFGAVLDFAIQGDNRNVLSITKADGFTIQIDYVAADITTNVASGLCQIYGIESDGVQAYLMNINKFDMAVQAGDIPFQIPATNVVEWFIENDSYLSKLSVEKDGARVVNTTKSALLTMTSYENKLETYSASTPFLDVNLLPTGGLESSLADTVNAILTATGTATINSYVFHLDFDLTAYESSQAVSNSKIASQVVNTKSTSPAAKAIISDVAAQRIARAEAKYSNR